MKRCRRQATFALLLAAASVVLVSGVNSDKNKKKHDGSCPVEEPTCRPATTTAPQSAQSRQSLQEQCGLFLAESSIPHAGWGMYTGVDLDEMVEIPPVDVVIPVMDHAHHMDLYHAFVARRRRPRRGSSNNATLGRSSNDNNKKNNNNNKNTTSIQDQDLPPWLMAQYYWDSGMTHNWYDAEAIESVVPGLGMLANSHPGMITAENMGPRRPRILGGGPAHGTTTNPAPGAASTYQDQHFQSLSELPAGHEIFVEYGDEWFADRFDRTFGLSQHYMVANRLVERWQRLILDPYYNQPKPRKSQQQQQMQRTPQTGNHYNDMIQDMRDLMLTTIENFQPRLHSVLDRIPMIPPSFIAESHANQTNHHPQPTSTTLPFQRLVARDNPAAYASVPNARRPLDWLYDRGLCLDHLTPGNSTVVPGERGAFATRHLPRGTIVAPAPVVHMARDHLRMMIVSEYPEAHPNDDPILWQGHQLLLNYVLGHNESSMLFFPYSPAVNLINHYKPMMDNKNTGKQKESATWSRMGGGSGGGDHQDSNDDDDLKESAPAPNVKLQWSEKMPHREWLESWTTDQVLEECMKAGLVMELVALTDIRQGDELLLDYGDLWETAFEQYLQSGQQQPMELVPVDIHQHVLPTVNDDPRTNGSGDDDIVAPLPSHVQTVCWIDPKQRPEHALEKPQEVKKGWVKWISVRNTGYLSDTAPCTIVGRSRDGNYYNVLVPMEGSPPEDVDPKTLPEESRIQSVPRRAIAIVPMPYSGVEMRRSAFRHEIQLPDVMIPEHWRDLKRKVEAPLVPIGYDEEVERPEQGQCGLYMAESSISNAGWGIFAGQTIEAKSSRRGQSLSYSDIVIQVEDFAQNQKLRKWFHNESMSTPSELDDLDWILSRYTWRSDATYGANLEADDIESVIPGLGMLANSHTEFANAHLKSAQRVPSSTKDPSFGATSHYHNARFVTKRKGTKKGSVAAPQSSIVRGEEIFVDFGENQLDGKRPLQVEYINADRALQRLERLKKVHGENIAAELWRVFWDSVDMFDQQSVNGTVPRDMNEATQVLSQRAKANKILPNRIRPMQWLEEHGSCIDNLRPGESSIPMAGGGAFASRPIGEDSVIAPLPLIHVHRHHMEIYHSNNPKDPNEQVNFVGHQQLLNYMYGHNESSLLLLPYSPIVNYINHAPTNGSSGGDAPTVTANAKLQWSSSLNADDWLKRSPSDLLKAEKRAGLVLELVATRAIARDEEILIDYGPEWQQTWQDHMTNWQKTGEGIDYVPPENDWMEWVPTKDERKAALASPLKPDTPNKVVGCHVRIPEKTDASPEGRSRNKRGVAKPRQFNWKYSEGMFDNTRTVYPCEVLERKVDADDIMYALVRKESIAPLEDLYVALINVTRTDTHGKRRLDQHIVHNVPRRAVEAFDRKYTSPMFYRGAFRHEIGLPDHLIPDAWRDLKP